jgi:hypothetical protein
MSEYGAKLAKCPYYIENNCTYQLHRKMIRCEGVNKDSICGLMFRSAQKEQKYREAHCYNIVGCKRCLIHKMLDEKWGVEDEKK